MLVINSHEEFNEIVVRAHKAGFQLAVHANGDKAIEMTLEAYERALENYPRIDHRHRIEHCTILNQNLLKRMKKLGVMAVPFGVFLWHHGEKVVPFYGLNRAEMMFPHRFFLKENIQIAGSSDCPAMPFDPLLAIQTCVTRETNSGTVVGSDQRISPEEALRVYTLGGAYASFEEDIKGSIEIGKLADVVVLSDDPRKVDPQSIKDIRVMMTIVGGKISYRC
jgi:predicted amidohydrolase YtcJ